LEEDILALAGRGYFYDSLWGFFRPPENIIKVFDTYEVQRLSQIRQTAALYLVYRGATHTRLEHSIGVTILAARAMTFLERQLKKYFKESEIKEGEELALICAIVHDVGHGPFSHFFEELLSVLHPEYSSHEAVTREVIRGSFWDIDQKMVSRYTQPIKEVIESIGISPEEVARYSTGHPKEPFDPKEFIPRLIASPVDVDRIDYINRDIKEVGVVRGGIDPDSIIQNYIIWKEEEKGYELLISEYGIEASEALLTSRDLLYSGVYSHPVNLWALSMLLRATLMLIEEYKQDWRELIRLTDNELIRRISQIGREKGDKFLEDCANRIILRRPYTRVSELEYRPRDFKRAKDKDAVKAKVSTYIGDIKKEMEIEQELEEEFSKNSNSEVKIIMNFPSLAKFKEAKAEVLLTKEKRITQLENVSLLTKMITEQAFERRWKMHVFTNVEKGSEVYTKIVKRVREELGLEKVEPSLLLN
jgi:HD superfamily phosphohydrolase